VEIPPDIEIAQSAKLKPITEIAAGIGLSEDDIEPYGKYKAKISLDVLKRLKDRHDGKLIIVTAITPTKAGEGKTTAAIGLSGALWRLGMKNIVVLRQPSLGPTFGIKGGACGGGYSQVLPMEDININFTGDLHAITVAHDLLASMLENHIYRGNKLNINIHEILWKRVLDIESRCLRNIVAGLGGRLGGTPYETGFEITTASEIAAIHAIATDLMDMKRRMGEITVAYNKDREPVKARELKADGAMGILMKEAVKPNLVQTIENTPAIIHGGPFANIAHGCPSIVAIKTALKLADYVVVEPGFGADLGMEKFCDIASRVGGLKPDAAIIVATIRALKVHGGVRFRKSAEPNLEAVERGLPNLEKQVENARRFGLSVVVALNRFDRGTDEEVKTVMDWCKSKNIPVALNEVYAKGGEGGIEMAERVLEEIRKGEAKFSFLYPLDMPVEEKIRTIATNMYGVSDIKLLPDAKKALRRIERLGFDKMPICMARTHLSLTDNPRIKGVPPEGYVLPITDLKPSTGVGFIVAYSGDISTMPALPSHPVAEKMDIDENGRIIGLS